MMLWTNFDVLGEEQPDGIDEDTSDATASEEVNRGTTERRDNSDGQSKKRRQEIPHWIPFLHCQPPHASSTGRFGRRVRELV